MRSSSEDDAPVGLSGRLSGIASIHNIEQLRAKGLPAHEIALELNRRRLMAAHGAKWDADKVTRIIELAEAMRSAESDLGSTDEGSSKD